VEDEHTPSAELVDSPHDAPPVYVDDELAAIGPQQLDAFDQMQRLPSVYTSRVVEHVQFIPSGGQEWERQVQLRLPSGEEDEDADSAAFIVSLGRFQRRRFPDFTVTHHDGSRCTLVSRRQHGHCLAVGLLRPFLYEHEWASLPENPLATSYLERCRSYVGGLVTTMRPTTEYTPGGARVLFHALLVALGVDLPRIVAAGEVFENKCAAALVGTQYLCWIEATPGATVQLTARYTQSDAPSTNDETDIHRPPPRSEITGALRGNLLKARLWWRNRRTSFYAKTNVFPVRYNFPTPAHDHCGSYYFTLTPPAATQVTFLDWERGHLFCGDGTTGRRISPDREGSEGTDGAELDCADYAYHFYNRRVPGRVRLVTENRRVSRRAAGVTIRAFLRAEPADNERLVAVGALSAALAAIAGTGGLFASSDSSAGQWVLLAPAALSLFVSQQRQHHYAYFTRPFRRLLWVYIALAMLFAGTAVFGFADPPFSATIERLAPRYLSGTFLIASLVLMIAFAWNGQHYERVVEKRYRRVMRRVDSFGTASMKRVIQRYRWRRRYWSQPTTPLPDSVVSPDVRSDHPSHKVFGGVARHAIDRVLIQTAIVVAVTTAGLFYVGWGRAESCSVTRLQAERNATEAGRAFGGGQCIRGIFHPTMSAPSTKHKT
jgi:hypothetical protein